MTTNIARDQHDNHDRTVDRCREVPPVTGNRYSYVYASSVPMVPAPRRPGDSWRLRDDSELIHAVYDAPAPTPITPAVLSLLHDLGLVSDRNVRDARHGVGVAVVVNGEHVCRRVVLADDKGTVESAGEVVDNE
ncbi:hypothetical protein [Corynebacterium glyciniphilum]|uniref:hypothetical protein n=1 Tax=Corynebacterium glyciniphilum TaxID=1404244 RepID=UPI003FD56FBD